MIEPAEILGLPFVRHADDCAAGAARLTAPPASGLRRRKLVRPRTRRVGALDRAPCGPWQRNTDTSAGTSPTA
jgi:hypothetical protein